MHTFPLHAISVVKRRRHGSSRGGSQAASVPTTVTVNPAPFVVAPTATAQLVATVLDQFGAPMPGESVTWTSADPSIATVDTNGLVTGVADGSTTITATDGAIHGDAACTVQAVTGWYVSPTGSASNAGTPGSPWDLATGLAGGPTGTEVQPGDQVWLRAGTYGTGIETYTASVSGSAGQPVKVMPFPGEMFAINCKQIDWTGHDVWLWNDDRFNAELYCGAASPDGTDLTRFQDAGTLKSVNWVVHDGGGIGLAPQSETADHEMNGNIVYNNGRSLTLSPTFGHGIYAHGTTTVGQLRKIRGNIVFNQAAYGIHTFADTGNEKSLQVHWNFCFANGVATDGGGGHVGYDMLVGGQTALTDCDVKWNRTASIRGAQTAAIGYLADGDPGAVGSGGICQYNYFHGGVNLGNWDNAGFTNTHNIFIGGDGGLLVRWKFQAASIQFTGNLSDFNTYVSTEPNGYFAASYGGVAQDVIATYATLADLRAALGAGQEANSTLVNASDLGTDIKIWNSDFVAGRSHLWIDNPSGALTVAVDISKAVAVGQPYEIWDVNNLKTATNPSATPVLSGASYPGGTVDVPMNAATPKALQGNEFPVADAHPFVACFVILQTAAGGTPSITPSPTLLTFSATAGGSNPAVQTVSLSSSPGATDLVASIGYTDGSGWLGVALDSNQTDATLTVNAITGALAAGTYNATITITSSNAATITIPVTFTVSAAGGDPAGFDTLQTALGGAAHVQAAYERRQHWSATSVTDCRFSGGTGPALSPTGAPTLDGSSNLVFSAGDDMHSAANAMFALTTAGSLLITGAITADGANAVGLAPTAGAAVLIIAEGAAGKVGVWSDHETDTTVAESATLRPIIITWDGINSGTVQVGNNTPVAFTASANFDAGNGVLTLGGFFTASGTNGGCVIAGIIKVDHQVNSTEATAFITYSTGQLGSTA